LVEPHSRILPLAPWALDPAQVGGGCVLISTPHMIDMFMCLTKGERVSVQSAVLSNRAEGNKVEDYAHYTLVSEGGAVGSIEIDAGYVGMSDRGSEQKRHGRARFVYQEFTARFSDHYFSAPDIETLEVTDLRRWREVGSTGDAPVETLHVSGHIATGMSNACKDMLARARAGREPLVTVRDMAEVIRLVDDIYATGRGMLGPDKAPS
jgi:predicted dehydrogenase